MFSNENPFYFSMSAGSSPWSDTASWQSTLSNDSGSASHQDGLPLSGLDLYSLATTPGHFIFGQQNQLPTPRSADQSICDTWFQSTLSRSANSQAIPQTDFVLFPESRADPTAHYTPSPQPFQTPFGTSVTVAESPAARAANQLLYVDKATSTSHDEAERPRKRIKITRSPPVAQKRRKPRHKCKLPECGKNFGRPSDLVRHQQDVHGLSGEFYECEAHTCLYRTRRNDKMKEHCQKMHGHRKGDERFAVVSGESKGGQGAGQAAG